MGIPPGPSFDLEGAGTGTCLVWHIAYHDTLSGVAVGNNTADIQGCYDLSNAIIVTRFGVDGGTLTTIDGDTALTICAGDSISDAFDVTLTGIDGDSSAWVITDPNGKILGLPAGPPFDLEGAGAGTCLIWHVSYNGAITGVALDSNASDIMGCYDLSNSITVTRSTGMTEGGTLTTTSGDTALTICAGDGMSDAFDVALTGEMGTNSGWVITDPNGMILGLPAAPPFDLEGAGTGVCLIWHIAYEDGLAGAMVR